VANSANQKGMTCPVCHKEYASVAWQKKFTTPGIIVLIAGLLLSPVCIGILMIFIAFGMRENKWWCSTCRRLV
jgi:hypothetical protein